MESKHLVQLATILDSGSISAAANRLNVTQPTLTRNIQTLEMQAGGPLFTRSRHGVKQTPLGADLARYGRAIAKAVWSARQVAIRHGLGLKQELRIGVGPLLANNLMNQMAQDLMAEHDDLSLLIRVDTPYRLIEQIHDEELDLVFSPKVQSPTQDLVCELVLEDRLVVVAARQHTLAKKAFDGTGHHALALSELNDWAWINMGTYARFEESPVERLQAMGVTGIHTPIALSGDAAITLNILREGNHLSLMPEKLTSRVTAEYNLVVLPVEADFGRRDVFLWHRAQDLDQGWVQIVKAAFARRMAT
ncbi:MAG: LysR family transcriptional regulator [Saccharospirillum sp.]